MPLHLRSRLVAITLSASVGVPACNAARGDTVDDQSVTRPEHDRAETPGAAESGRPEVIQRKERFEGTVEESLSAGSYTYFSVRLDAGEQRWAVVLGGKQQPAGSRLHLQSFGIRYDFSSPRLEREFDELYFCSVESSN